MIFYLLNKGQQTVKLLNNDETIESNLDEAINTASELKFSLPLQKRLDSNIYYILIPEYHGNDFLMFKVISEDIQKDRVEYSAVESAYDELKSYDYIKDIRPHQMNAAQMLQQVLKNTRWSLGYVEDTGIQSTTFYYITILEAIQKIVDLFKVELTFTIQLDPVTQKITGRKVNLYQQQGRRTGKRFEYGSNLLTVTREENSQNLVTALVGRGKGIQVSGQNTEDTTDDGYGRRLTFADVEWKTTAGAPVNKPKGQEYVEDPKATALYGFSDGHPRIGLVTFEDIEDPNQLINATWSALLEAKRPKVSFKAEVTDVGNLQLGDTIAIIRHDLGIEYFTRVYKVHHNLKDENRNTVEMGDDFSSRSITSAISNVIQISQDATLAANTAAIAANGKNRNFYSNTKPEYANEGDNLFLNLGNGETEMWVWHHGQWEFVQSTVELHTVQKQVQEAQDGLKDAKKEIADNLAKADSDISELNASIGNQNSKIAGLQSTVSSNYGNLQSQISQTAGTIRDEITNKVSGVQSQITQNVNNLNLRINNTSRNLVLNSGNFQNLNGWYTNSNGSLTLGKHGFWKNGTENVLWINNPSKTNEVTVSSARFYVQPHTTYTISFYAFASTNVRDSDLYFLGRKRNSNKDFEYIIQPIASRRYSPSRAEYITVTINTGESEEGYLRFDHNGSTDGYSNLLAITDIQMEEGSVATPWKPAASDQVLAQINVAAGTTLIQNDKIYMDASSTIFSGKAFIPNAAITNISADKINTGTLDAGRINVINLNANNITTGTINGANLKINLNDGEILFQKGRIASTNGNLNIDIDSGTMSVTNWMNEGVYFKDGKLILDDRGFGGLIADNPKYGVIQRSNQMFNNNAFGMELNSPNGVSLRTSNYDGVINTGSGLDGTKNGAVISVDKDGSAVVNGAGTTFLTGGPKFSQSKYSIGTRPHIWIGTFNARLGDRIEIDANYIHLPTTYYRTTGSAPNLCIASDGALVRSTSASKYKTDIKRSYSTEYGEKLLNLPTAIWTDKGQKERYEAGKRHIKPEKYFGMIAEDLADAGLDLLISRNPQTHEIEGIQYERIAPALLPVIKELKDKVNRLEKKVNE